MIVTYTDKSYRITYDGVSMVENALDNPNLIQISVISGCTIMVAPNEYGIDLLPNKDFRNWSLTGINTALVRAEAHHIYARLRRTEKEALIVFSINDYAIDGKIKGVEGSEPSTEYYYIKIGKITNTNSITTLTLDREISYDGGVLKSDGWISGNAGGWNELFAVTTGNLINALKRFASFTVQGTLNVIGRIVLNEKQISGIQRNEDKDLIIDEETIPTTKFLLNKYIDSLRKTFLSKDQEDTAFELIVFLKGLISEYDIIGKSGLEIGKTIIDSLLAGSGILAKDGRMQLDRLEVRSSMVVMRLIVNDLQAMAGDYSFSDCGYIDKVEDIGNGSYKLWLEKRTDTDWTTLDIDDVLFSIVNTLLTGGTDYYKSWFRPVSKNRNDNTLTVVLYPDSEVPGGKNYPPAAGYNVARHGNAIIPDAGDTNERAQSWMISSREGRMTFLQNMFKPIIEDYNYALTIGRFPNVKMIEKLPISPTDVGVMAKTIVAENIYQADWNGDIISKKVDRGEWSLSTAQSDSPYRFITHEILQDNQSTITQLEQHTVTYSGCTWGCLIDKTLLEPGWNSPAWSFLLGDPNYHLSFTIPGGTNVRINQVDLTVTAWVEYANRDITNVLMAAVGTEVEWLRDTKNAPADNMWKPTYVNGQKNVIHIDNSNDHGVGRGFGIDYREVVFICRVFIPIGDKLEKIEKSIGLKI